MNKSQLQSEKFYDSRGNDVATYKVNNTFVFVFMYVFLQYES